MTIHDSTSHHSPAQTSALAVITCANCGSAAAFMKTLSPGLGLRLRITHNCVVLHRFHNRFWVPDAIIMRDGRL